MLTLAGVGIVVLGFVLRLNPLLVIAASALVTGMAAGLAPLDILAAFGKAFNENRYVSVVFVVLPVIGLLERFGLQQRARLLIGRVRAATAGRLLFAYFLLRQVSAAIGLVSLGGQAQMVRPLVAPMAEAAAEREAVATDAVSRAHIRAHAAAADNIALFFGEDIFLAIGSVLLIKGFLQQNGIFVEPLQLSFWAIPTAACALIIHGARLLLLDRRRPEKKGGAA